MSRRLAITATVATALITAAGVWAEGPAPTTAPVVPAAGVYIRPAAATPAPATRPALLPMRTREPLPPAEVIPAPRLLPSEANRPLTSRPALDVPPLGRDQSVAPAVGLLRPVMPLAQRWSPDPTTLPAPRPARPDAGRATALTDPGEDLALKALLAEKPTPRQTPAPFVRFATPDPFEVMSNVQPATVLPDADPPVITRDLPGKPPVGK